jgi:ribosomal small subunit protein bTHX
MPPRLLALCLLLSCAPRIELSPPPGFSKPVAFALLQDYDKGEDLREVERDFELMRELGIDTWRGSFGWDDYEPARDSFDFAWLHRFAELAARHGIKLRPYLGYTPAWAANGGSGDGQDWNDPPARLDDWRAFVRRIAGELRRHPNVLSFEIYNEENTRLWWDGTVEEYEAVLRAGADEVRAANGRAHDGVRLEPGSVRIFESALAGRGSQLHHSRRGAPMGKGDRKTRRGKIFRGTYGKRRPRKKRKPAGSARG